MKTGGDGSEGDLVQARRRGRRELVGRGGDRVEESGWRGWRGEQGDGGGFTASFGSASSDGSVPSPLAWGISLG
jgi:hypothetical protein